MVTVTVKWFVRTTVLLLFCALMLPIFAGIFNINRANCDPATDWWTAFRHDSTHSGYSTSTAPTTNQSLWNFTGDSVFSSPAVVGGVVFVGSVDGNLYALNATNGDHIWNFTTGSWVWSSPAVASGVVYIGSDDGNVYAFGTPSYVTVGGELSQTSYVESFFVPTLIMLGISGAISMLGFAHIKRSKQTRTKPHKA